MSERSMVRYSIEVDGESVLVAYDSLVDALADVYRRRARGESAEVVAETWYLDALDRVTGTTRTGVVVGY